MSSSATRPERVVIATRRSRLALWQAEHVKARLMQLYPWLEIELLAVSTRGDELLEVRLDKAGGKGLFVKELENALAEGRADLAVHSMKDVPMDLPPGFALPVISAREDPRDAFVSNRYQRLAELPSGAVLGTASLRRAAQIAQRHPQIEIRMLRGNVDTRLAKLDRGEFDAVLLAAAGLKRLGLEARIRALLETDESLPAAGQGALGIECRAGRPEIESLVAPLGDAGATACVRAERAVNRELGGNCSIPLGAYAELMADGTLHLRALVASPDGRQVARPGTRRASRSVVQGGRCPRNPRGARVMGVTAQSDTPLARRGIVVTRPREQAQTLASLIEAAGGTALVFPAIEIQDPPDSRALLAVIGQLEQFDLAVFVSPSAVYKAMNLMRSGGGAPAWPPRLRLAAIGRGSRRELERQGFAGVIAPAAHADSEALLALPELNDVAGRKVVIFRGDGGRELLGDTLKARGAQVEYAECYRRVRPRADCAPLLAAWARGAVHAVTVSSAEGLSNLFEMLGEPGRRWLLATPVFVPHPRVAEEALRLGIRDAPLGGPGDSEMLESLVAYFRCAK
jgi:hydroxymethylbilane synthase